MVDTRSHARKTFLRGLDVEREAKELISHADAGRVRVAVAYWGVGSVDRLDIKSVAGNDITIVCDLMSGACNPIEIKGLLKAFQKPSGNSRVLMRDHLHAKVWLTDRGAIVGSSNASTNGLGFEGDELKDCIEANVFVDDAETLAAIDRWFEKDVMEDAKEITKADLKEAHRRWKRHRTTRPLPFAKGSLLEELRAHPSFFADRDFMVWVYEATEFDEWAEQTLDVEQKTRGNSSISGWQNIEGPIPPAGAYILEFFTGKNQKAKLGGLYQVLMNKPLITRGKSTLLLCEPLGTFDGRVLGDRKSWEQAATKAANSSPSRDEWRIEDFCEKFLKIAPVKTSA
jgi:PLD-like domain